MERVLKLQKLAAAPNAEMFDSNVSCGCTGSCNSADSYQCTGATQVA